MLVSRPSVSRCHDLQANDGWVVYSARSGGITFQSGGLGLWWRHFVMISERRFSTLSLLVIIASFSSRQRLHIPLFLLYVFDFFMTSHLILCCMFFFFKSHIYFESSVSFSYLWCLKDFVWFLCLSLKVPPVLPMYAFVSFPCVRRHYPASLAALSGHWTESMSNLQCWRHKIKYLTFYTSNSSFIEWDMKHQHEHYSFEHLKKSKIMFIMLIKFIFSYNYMQLNKCLNSK